MSLRKGTDDKINTQQLRNVCQNCWDKIHLAAKSRISLCFWGCIDVFMHGHWQFQFTSTVVCVYPYSQQSSLTGDPQNILTWKIWCKYSDDVSTWTQKICKKFFSSYSFRIAPTASHYTWQSTCMTLTRSTGWLYSGTEVDAGETEKSPKWSLLGGTATQLWTRTLLISRNINCRSNFALLSVAWWVRKLSVEPGSHDSFDDDKNRRILHKRAWLEPVPI